MSGDGSVVVGHADVTVRKLVRDPADPAHPYYDPPLNVQRAFIWDRGQGIRSLNDALWFEYNFNPGLTLTSALAISDDGGRIAGQGLDGTGANVWFELEVPEPDIAGFGVILTVAIRLAIRRREAQC